MVDTEEKNTIQDQLVKQVVTGEYRVAQTNQDWDNSDFESYVDMFDANRSSKEYDWMSDISIPEFASHMLTQSSLDVGQYFQTRDFVEVYLEDEGDEAKANAAASKELINRTLNQKHLYHYQKFVRAKTLNQLSGKVYLKCWWEQETITDVVGQETILEELDVDDYGNPLVYEDQRPALKETTQDVYGEVPVIDRFNYDVYDPRNVFTDNSYSYSLQDKDWVIFRDEITLNELENQKERNGYFNLDKLKEAQKPSNQSDTANETYNKDENQSVVKSSIEKMYDRIERYGKFWAIVDRDENGLIVEGSEKIGLDRFGEPLEDADLYEVIITIVINGGSSTLIGFKLTPYISVDGLPYRPLIRGLCYIHPTNDGGVGDGKYAKELQIAIDDTFNMGQDRTTLATIPTFTIVEDSQYDNSDLYIAPGHPIPIQNQGDFRELPISDNITGALNQISMLMNKMQQVDAVQPPSMGQTANLASTTATSAALADQGTTTRSNYKSLTFENTALCELYWMIQQMTFMFAKPETGEKLMGDKVYDFNPERSYYYKPLSQSIETEQSKAMKRKEWTTLFGYVAQVPHPDTPKMINFIFNEITKLMGDEYANFGDKFLDESKPITENGQSGGQAQPGGSPTGISNQNGIQMSTPEQATREMSYG